mmetsp:Transcript_33723/g.24757  ORF Transcript_33723/g.24757 Transcript_33723/m.24757 type:complete len:150 (-) Transcript_33723:53-502(-)
MSWTDAEFGKVFSSKSGEVQVNSSLSDKKFVGIYFSAHWCPPCRAFTPVLGEIYDQIKETVGENELEIVFVSSDSDEGSFAEYYSHMPWLALPFSDRSAAQELGRKYGVRGIPSLIILNGQSGVVVDRDGRSTISSARGDVEKILSKWK